MVGVAGYPRQHGATGRNSEILSQKKKKKEDNLNKWKEICVPETGGLVKVAVLFKLAYKFKVVPVRIPAGFA